MIIGLMLIAYSSMIFCGCGKETPEEVISVVENTVNEIIEDIDEEITVSENGINCIVDNRGYTNDEEKKVFFKDIDVNKSEHIIANLADNPMILSIACLSPFPQY